MSERKEQKKIAVADLVVGYEGKSVLANINFCVHPGEILTLIGPNGSGKSTLLKSITRQLQTIAGNVWVDGEAVEKITDTALAKKMSMVMTERIAPELMTCREVVETGRYPYTGRFGIFGEEDKKKVQDAMCRLHALDVADKLFTKVSDGQRQRVMLARALCQEPDILILDEPTSYLDMHYKLEILQSVRDIARKENLAVVMSLHELDLAQKVSDVVACVDGDSICAMGKPEEIFCGDTIASLYDVKPENFDVVSGNMFLQRAEGTPQVFVIGGGGSGVAMYYALQREQIAFSAGILQENDVEYAAARALATDVVATPAFFPITMAQITEARKRIDTCTWCMTTLTEFGPGNQANQELISYAKEQGKFWERKEMPWQK